MVENAVAIRDAGCTLDEAVTWLEAEKSTNNIFFTVGNLDYLIKGGRIGKVSGRAANFLGIKPMILFKDGEIFSGGVARGRQKSFEKALEQLMNYLDANGGTPDDYRIIVGYGYDEEEANGSGCRPVPPCVPSTPPHSARWACFRSAAPSRSIPAPMRWAWASCAAGKSSNRWIKKILSHRERIFVCYRVLSALSALRQTGRALVFVLFVILRGRCGVGEPDFGDAAAGRAGHDAS